MKRATIFFMVFAAFLYLSGISAFAQHGPGGPPAGKGPGSAASPGADRPHPGSSRDAGRDAADTSGRKTPAEILSHNTALAKKLKDLGVANPAQDCQAFKNLGQCVAAAHVAKNLDIPGGFDALKAKMTGPNAVSLGKAIQELDPKADAKAEAKKANKQAKDDLSDSGS